MPYIELQDPTGQKHTCESSQPEVCMLWIWEMLAKYSQANRGKPAIEIRMVALTVELPDRVAGPDWIRGYDERAFGPLEGDNPIDLAKALVREMQYRIEHAENEHRQELLYKAQQRHAIDRNG